MGILNLFKNKKEEVEQQVVSTINSNPCEHCGNNIESWEKGITFNKKKYHVKCFRKLKKQAARMTLNP